jgi:hypothetical protein
MLDAGELSSLVGYTAIASGSVDGDVEGNDGELIKLDSGMIFELDGFNPMVEFDPEVVVFEWIITPVEAKRLFQRDTQQSVALYKLVIGDELVDAFRVR